MKNKISFQLIILCISILHLPNILNGQSNCVECSGNSATGEKSTAIGINSYASGDYSFSSGNTNVSQGQSSISMGDNCNADEMFSVAIGHYCSSYQRRSYSFGDHAIANAEPSMAIGHFVQSNASRAITIGSSDNQNPLINNEPNSLMIGFLSSFPTFFVGPTPYGQQFGKVGIGTTNPQTTLDVNGGILTKEFAMLNGNQHDGYVLTCNELGYADWEPGSQSLWNEGVIPGDIYRLDGNVGIGTTMPYNKFQIGEKWTFINRAEMKSIGFNISYNYEDYYRIQNGPGAMLNFEPSGAISMWMAPDGISGTQVDPWVESIIFDNFGNVGIGTRTPETELHVEGKIKTNEFQMVSGTFANGYILRCSNDGTAFWDNPDELDDGDWNVYVDNIWVDENKKVGIGTSTPGQELDLAGNMKISGDIIGAHNDWQSLRLFGGTDENDGAFLSIAGNYNNIGSIKLYTLGIDGRIEFHNDNMQVMSIRGDNTVVMGHPSEDGSGDVTVKINGYMSINEVNVTTDNWWDKVLKPGYDLRSLNELEVFILENNHLPDVPPEEEILEEGINLAEMNAILLKKIEELTLYTIEQQKEIEELKKLLLMSN